VPTEENRGLILEAAQIAAQSDTIRAMPGVARRCIRGGMALALW
jgi:hypothetical protein